MNTNKLRDRAMPNVCSFLLFVVTEAVMLWHQEMNFKKKISWTNINLRRDWAVCLYENSKMKPKRGKYKHEYILWPWDVKHFSYSCIYLLCNNSLSVRDKEETIKWSIMSIICETRWMKPKPKQKLNPEEQDIFKNCVIILRNVYFFFFYVVINAVIEDQQRRNYLWLSVLC